MSELKQNYIRVFANQAGTITIVASDESDDIEQIELSSLTVHPQDAQLVASAIISAAQQIVEEKNQ